MGRHVQKALVALGLSCVMLVTSVVPSMTVFAEGETGDTGETGGSEDTGGSEETEEPGTNLALTATAGAAYTNVYLEGNEVKINDGTLATADSTTSWNCWGAAEEKYPMEVTLTWDEAQTMSSTRVMWWADGGGVTFPGGAELAYLDSESKQWVDLPNVGAECGGLNGENGVWNVVNFDTPITTTSLRMKVARGSGYNAIGISEWEVYAETLQEDITGASITGGSKVSVGETVTLTGNTKPEKLSDEASYAWSISDGTEYLSIEGVTNQRTVQVKGLEKGTATLTLTVTREGITQTVESDIRVMDEKIESIDTYQTSTAAGKAPILPDTVVANGIEFDEPTSSTLEEYGYEYAETFNSKLLPVTWEEVDAASYAADKAGTTFIVTGTVSYADEEYEAKAEITVTEPAEVGASNSSVTFENVQLEDDFWLPKQETNAMTSLDVAIAQIEKASGGEPNFDNAIKKLNGESYEAFSGFVFQDSDIYKSIEAISYTLSATQNDTSEEAVAQRTKLAQKLDSWIEKIEKVQYADGYIDTFFTLRSTSYSGGGKPGTHRWWEMSNHEMYNAGHFLEAVVAYTRYREGIGDPDYRLYVAGKRFADEIVAVFGPEGTRYEVPGHEEIELALVKFGKLAEEYEGKGTAQDYYDTAQTLIDRRGQNQDQRDSGYSGGTYSQDETPFVDETNAVGHAVRANYFYTGIADVATLLPEEDETRAAYINSLDTIWDSVTEKKTYITGGIGTTTAGSDAEGFGQDYDLPPGQSYCEICAAIGAANWNLRMNLLHEDGKYADMVETNLYNSILVGTNLDGNRFYYSTLLEVDGGNSRSEWFACACCPPNLMRTIASLGGYMYNVHNDNLFVNMYAGSSSNVNVNGTDVEIKQETNYPWNGDIKMTVTPQEEKTFAMKLRIPGWVNEQKNKTVVIKVNGEEVDAAAENGYVTIDRTWASGDVVDIAIPMEIRLTESNENVEATQGRIAIERGPIVYCIEKAGNAQLNADIEDFDPLNFVIPHDAELTATYNENLLKGVVEITGDVKYATGNDAEMIDAKLQAVPYYAWNNRGDDADYEEGLADPKNNSSKMLIWTMADEPIVQEKSVRDEAAPSVSYVGWGAGADNFADGNTGTFWNGHSDPNLETSPQWMMYDFGEKKAKLTGSRIMFYDDGGGVMTPTAITIEYEAEDGTWKEVTPVGDWTYEGNIYNTYEFEEIVTSKIRVTMTHAESNGSKVAVAVNEWYLDGELAGTEDASAAEAKEELDTAIAEAGTKAESEYTAESWKKFADALAAAKAVAADANATKDDLEQAKADLAAAANALVKKSAENQNQNPDSSQNNNANQGGSTTPGGTADSGQTPAAETLQKGDTITVSGVKYRVTDAAKKQAEAYAPSKKTAKTIKIANTVKVKGVSCKVVSIAPNAFAKMKKLTSVTIPKNVATIGKQAFYKSSKLKKVKMQCTSPKSIGKNAFKGIAKKATIDVPNKQLKKYKKLLKKAKTASTVKVK